MIWFQFCREDSRPAASDRGITALSKRGLLEGSDLQQVRLNIYQGLSNAIWNKAIRRCALLDEGIVQRARYYGEDFSRLLLALPKINSCLVLNDVFYCYVDTEGSISKRLKAIYLQDIDSVSRQLLQVAQIDGTKGIEAAGTGILAQYYNLLNLACDAHDDDVIATVAGSAQNALKAANLPTNFLPSNRKLRLLYHLIMRGNTRAIKLFIPVIEFIKPLLVRIEGSR